MKETPSGWSLFPFMSLKKQQLEFSLLTSFVFRLGPFFCPSVTKVDYGNLAGI